MNIQIPNTAHPTRLKTLSENYTQQVINVHILANRHPSRPTINYHIKKIFVDSELEENSVIRSFRITAADGKTYNTREITGLSATRVREIFKDMCDKNIIIAHGSTRDRNYTLNYTLK